MDIRVSGHQVDVGDAFRTHVEERLNQMAEKYFPRAISATVTLAREARGHGFHLDCQMYLRQGVFLKAEATDFDPYVAFNFTADRLEKQLRRYKRRLKDNHNGVDRTDMGLATANYTILQPRPEEEEAEEEHPVIVAETQEHIPEVSVSDAVMLMDMRQAPALLFRNAGNGQLAMVYRRTDGNIGWVEPHAQRQAEPA
ncbi:ribosome hibernation-promoting factor, HPF/YfiA family [Pedomonas mirosovicensis]|uniref:ribosome hibernation-promoting factor, HPF/YfiA family n=1 Tax=Pedomonas mirosovicensis TaxID=2908641 RepID=UPI002169B825|nr:ribosome-associated translation inhibitor RaiA [Pedomonas mirosovicensis]MCH8684058.1 ribosome-associated translation inhibitor RaiA [Pedomonas mirosovicensis]